MNCVIYHWPVAISLNERDKIEKYCDSLNFNDFPSESEVINISSQIFLSGNAFYSYKYYPSKIYLAPDEYVFKCIITKGSSYYLCTDYDGIKIYHFDKIKIN